MNIYKLTPLEDLDSYDRYQELIVIAENEESARLIHPLPNVKLFDDGWFQIYSDGKKVSQGCWASHPNYVAVEFVGVADSKYSTTEIICENYVGY